VTVLATANTPLIGASLGHCATDSFSISGGISATPVICGTNTGRHMIVTTEAGGKCLSANFIVGSSGSTSSWNIEVTQYECDNTMMSAGGPPGCLQYYTAATGFISSFAFPINTAATTAITAGATHLANQDYEICIKRATNACFICYTPIGATTTTAIINQSTFGLDVSNIINAANSIQNGACIADYLGIAGLGANTAGMEGTNGQVHKMCGRAFALTATIAHATLCTRVFPARITVSFDDAEVTTGIAANNANTNEQNGTPGGIIGFGLIYTQGTTSCISATTG